MYLVEEQRHSTRSRGPVAFAFRNLLPPPLSGASETVSIMAATPGGPAGIGSITQVWGILPCNWRKYRQAARPWKAARRNGEFPSRLFYQNQFIEICGSVATAAPTGVSLAHLSSTCSLKCCIPLRDAPIKVIGGLLRGWKGVVRDHASNDSSPQPR